MGTLKDVYIYTDDRGRPILRKCREDQQGEKRFSVQVARWYLIDKKRPAMIWKGGPGCVERYQPEWKDRVLFNLPVVIQALRAGEPVWLCEGERDAETVASVMRQAATTTHQSIERMTERQAEWFLTGDGPINILMDDDDAGRYGGWHRYTALVGVGVDKARLSLWLPRKGCKDITDAIADAGLANSPVRPASRKVTKKRAIRYRACRGGAVGVRYRAGEAS